MPISEKNALRDAVIAWAIVAVLVTLLVRIGYTLPLVGHVGSALVAVLFLFAPGVVASRRGEFLEDYGFQAEPVRRNLVTAAAAILIIFPLFTVGYFAFYEIACKSDWLSNLVPRGMCGRYDGLDGVHTPVITLDLLEFCAVQMVVVALPEELFFRGFLHGLLEKRFPPKRRFLGGGIGLALILSSLAFALIHLPKGGDPRDLATFAPGLMFGWMRSATGSILAPTLVHGASNILIRFLNLTILR